MEPVSPPLAFENQEDEELQATGKEDFGKRSSDLDLNQAVSPRADDDAEDFPSQPPPPQWLEEGNRDSDVASPQQPSPPPAENLTPSPSPKSPLPYATQQRRSPPPHQFSPSRSPKHTPSPVGNRAVPHDSKHSVSPVYRGGRISPPQGSSVSPLARRHSPPPARRRSPSPRRRQSPGTRRSLSRSPDERSILVGRSDEGRKEYDRRGSPRVGRSGRGAPPRGRERYGRSRSRSRSPARDSYRRSRYSPRRRASPPRYHSRRDRSPRRRPWSPPANRSTGVGKPGKNLFVAGFSFVTTERDLEKKFARYGRVTDVRIVRDKRSGDSRGFGFLSLERDEDADAAIRALDQTEWNGRIVLVEKAKTPTR